MWTNLKPIDTSKVKQIEYPANKYFSEEFTKIQIVLHHTVSGDNIDGDVSTWLNGKSNVGTPIIIDRLGVPYQMFSSRFWAYHLGTGNHDLDRHSIGIEIDNWGGLTLGDGKTVKFGTKYVKTIPGKFYNDYGSIVEGKQIQEYPNGFRGYKYFEKYTNEQIQTVGELLLLWNKKYNIPLDYNDKIWNYNDDAISGKPGLFTHVSYRKDKSDCHPQTELIEMLKVLKSLT